VEFSTSNFFENLADRQVTLVTSEVTKEFLPSITISDFLVTPAKSGGVLSIGCAVAGNFYLCLRHR
jgi:hypothetical protein